MVYVPSEAVGDLIQATEELMNASRCWSDSCNLVVPDCPYNDAVEKVKKAITRIDQENDPARESGRIERGSAP